MQQYSIHEATAPSISLTKVTLDGTHNGAFQTGLGNWRIYGWGVGSPILWTGHPALMPSGSFSKTTLDGTHNGAFQTSMGWRDLSLYSHDPSFIQIALTAILSLAGFIFSKFHGVYQFTVTAALSFVGAIQKNLPRRLTASLPFVGLFRKGRIFLGNLSFSATHAVIHTYRRAFTALLPFTTQFLSHWHSSYRLFLSAVLAFSALPLRSFGKLLNGSILFNLSPEQITGLRLWLKADSIQATDGAVITYWKDSSGNDFDASAPTTAAQPTYIANGVNDRPSVRFNGTSNFMRTQNINVAQPDTIFVVGKQNSTATYGIWFNGTQTNPRQEMQNQITSGNFLAGTGSNTWSDSINHAGAWHIFATQFVSANVSLYVDGAFAIGGAVANEGIAQVDFGGIDWGGGFYMAGDIAEILVYNRVITTVEFNQVNTYLSKKYGIAITGTVTETILSRLTQKILSAISSFVGLVTSLNVHFYPQLLTAVQSFSGAFSRIRIYNRLLTAALSFAGFIQAFSGHFVSRTLTAALAFVGLVHKIPSKLYGATAYFNFTPKSIPGLFMWLRADSLQLNDGDPVSSWPDLSGAANSAIATGTQRPTFKQGILNGKPVLRFDGVGNYLTTTRVGGLAQPDTLICVGKQNTTATYGIWFTGGGAAGGSLNAQFSGTSLGGGYFFINANQVAQDFTDHSGAFHIFTAIFSGLPGGYGGTGFVDGVALWLPVNVGSADFEDSMRFGAIPTSNYYTAGDIAELIAYSHALTDSELASIHSYLGEKYGITLAISSGGSLTKLILKSLNTVLDLAVTFIRHKTILFTQALAAGLFFFGGFIRTRSQAFTGAVSFLGSVTPYKVVHNFLSLASTLAFSATTIVYKVVHNFLTVTGAISFTGTLSTILHILYQQALSATLSFVTFIVGVIPIQQMLTATLSLIADFVSLLIRVPVSHPLLRGRLFLEGKLTTIPTVYALILNSILRFRSILTNSWNALRTLFLVLTDCFTQQIVYAGEQEAKIGQVVNNDQLIDITPTPIDFGALAGLPISVLYIKNIDDVSLVRVAGDDLFTLLPQSIPPGAGVYLSPRTDQVWAIAVGAPAMIHIVAAV